MLGTLVGNHPNCIEQKCKNSLYVIFYFFKTYLTYSKMALSEHQKIKMVKSMVIFSPFLYRNPTQCAWRGLRSASSNQGLIYVNECNIPNG